MKKMIIVAICISFSGCAARINKVMKSWQGQHFTVLIGSWGPPQQVFDDGGGGRIFIYTQQRQWTTPGSSTTTIRGNATVLGNNVWGSAKSTTTYNPSQTHGYKAYRMFYINKDGFIYNWAWRGL